MGGCFVVLFIELQLKATYSDSVNVETALFSFSSATSYPDAYESNRASTIRPNTSVGYSRESHSVRRSLEGLINYDPSQDYCGCTAIHGGLRALLGPSYWA
jgi:hypothetical protein